MTTEEVIATLKEDYSIRASLKRRDFPVQDEIEDEIEDLEQSYITSVVIPELKARAQELLGFLECEVTLGVKSDCNGIITVTDECVVLFPSNTVAEPDNPNRPNDPEGILLTMSNRRDVKGKHLRVTFNDGTVFEGNNSKSTYINALKKIGLNLVEEIGLERAGYNIVDKRQRTDSGVTWQEYVDGYWVYINLSNDKKAYYLLTISDHYGLNLKIEAI